jgi:carbonic anhydrase
MLIFQFCICLCLSLITRSAIIPTGLFCSNPSQSPINIVDNQAKYIPEKYFRILFVNYTNLPQGNKWTINQGDQSIQLGNTTNYSMGTLSIVRDYAIYNYNLNRILVRTPSDHQLNGDNKAVELQLIHTFNNNTGVMGRRILLRENYLVISILLDVNDNMTTSTTSLFDFTNLADFVGNNNQGFLRDIKVRYLLNNMPGYMYEGSLTSGNCDPALWIIQSNYNYITSKDYNNLLLALGKITSGLKGNNRSIQGSTSAYTVYKNVNTTYTYSPSLINYNTGSRMIYSNGVIFLFLFAYILNF